MRTLRGNMFRNTVIALPEGGQETEFTLEEWQNLCPRRAESVPSSVPYPENTDKNPVCLPVESEVDIQEDHSSKTRNKRRRRRSQTTDDENAASGNTPGKSS